jgi:hypothetical protein
MKDKPIVLAARPNKTDGNAVRLGKAILQEEVDVIVNYKNQKWGLNELVQYLAKKVNLLERNQCKPDGGCLFRGQDYYTKKYLEEEDDRE